MTIIFLFTFQTTENKSDKQSKTSTIRSQSCFSVSFSLFLARCLSFSLSTICVFQCKCIRKSLLLDVIFCLSFYWSVVVDAFVVIVGLKGGGLLSTRHSSSRHLFSISCCRWKSRWFPGCLDCMCRQRVRNVHILVLGQSHRFRNDRPYFIQQKIDEIRKLSRVQQKSSAESAHTSLRLRLPDSSSSQLAGWS